MPGDAAHRRAIKTGAVATCTAAARAHVPHREHPLLLSLPPAFSPAAAPAAVFSSGAAVAAAAVAARVADGVVLPGRPAADSAGSRR